MFWVTSLSTKENEVPNYKDVLPNGLVSLRRSLITCEPRFRQLFSRRLGIQSAKAKRNISVVFRTLELSDSIPRNFKTFWTTSSVIHLYASADQTWT